MNRKSSKMRTNFFLKAAITLSIFFCSSNIMLACSCAGESYFCQELNDTTDGFLHPNFVIKAIKLKDTLHGMFVKVETNYINEIFEDTILIWGDPGHLCRVYTSNFEVGESVILGIKKIETASGMPEESIGDYWLPACGVTYLKINNGIVEGPISMGINSMSLEDFEFYMESMTYATDCIITNTIDQNPFENSTINFYPNPANEDVFISCENCEEIDALTIFDASGQVKNIRYNKEDKLIRINLEGIEKGIYFVKLKSKDYFQTYKLLVL